MPYLTTRVFNRKLHNMVAAIKDHEVFGPINCFLYTIEWQKRGLPHAHMLFWLRNKIRPNQIDNDISAELPDPTVDEELFNCITRNMIHGPCGSHNQRAPCMIEGRCSKRYPHNYLSETISGEDGYPLYRRRSPESGGREVQLGRYLVDNRWVVPHNRFLCKVFNAHINVKYCHSVKSIKYICKYINKGSDMAVFQIENNNDEIDQFQTGRFISSDEAPWRIFKFPIHKRAPAVIRPNVNFRV